MYIYALNKSEIYTKRERRHWMLIKVYFTNAVTVTHVLWGMNMKILGFVTEKILEFVFSFQWGTIIGWTGGGSYTKKKIYDWITTLQAPCTWKAINILFER